MGLGLFSRLQHSRLKEMGHLWTVELFSCWHCNAWCLRDCTSVTLSAVSLAETFGQFLKSAQCCRGLVWKKCSRLNICWRASAREEHWGMTVLIEISFLYCELYVHQQQHSRRILPTHLLVYKFSIVSAFIFPKRKLSLSFWQNKKVYLHTFISSFSILVTESQAFVSAR